MRALVRGVLLTLVAGALAVLAFAGLTPIEVPESASRDALFEIPRGTWSRRMAGEDLGILPDEIHLTLGIRDILVLRNLDEVPQIFGPTLMMPGQSLRLPFEQASEYQFACTAHASGQMSVIVEPYPATPWARIRWRARELARGK
jgi:hypothetical protein